MQIHLYADDTQLYLPFQPDQSKEAMKRLNACVEDIRQWMENNFLKLNDTKTEFIIFGTPKDVGKVVERTVDVGDAIIILSLFQLEISEPCSILPSIWRHTSSV